MDSLSSQSISTKPPLYKQALVGLLVGGALGPVVGWFVGTLLTFFLVVMINESENVQPAAGMRLSAFVGGMLGILLGLITGVLVSLPLRIISSTIFKSLTNPWSGAAFGAVLGLGSGYLIHQYWHPSLEAFLFSIVHSVILGAVIGSVTVIAKPKWL